MTALQQFGAEMLKLSRGLESVASSSTTSPTKSELSTSHMLSFPHMPLQKQNSLQQYGSNQPLQMHYNPQYYQHQQHSTSHLQQLPASQLMSKQLLPEQQVILLDQQNRIANSENRTVTTSSSLTNTTRPFLPPTNFSDNFRTQKR